MVETCAAFGVAAERRDGHPGCWVDPDGPRPRKIGALGIRVERGVSYHGIALNIDPDLADFDLIDACGMPGVVSTSIAARAGRPGERRRPRRSSGRATFARPSPRIGADLGSTAPTPSSTRRAPEPRRRRWPRSAEVAAGLFELRKDAITGWWVATVVDRAFHRDRFALPAEPGRRRRRLPELPPAGGRRRPAPDAQGLRVPRRRHRRGGPRARGSVAQVSLADARASGSWRTIVAPPGEHRPLHAVGIRDDHRPPRERPDLPRRRASTTGLTDHLQVVQNWGAQAGARTNHLCLDLYDLPQIPHRIAEELGGAARFVIREGECPWCRLVRTSRPARTGSSGRTPTRSPSPRSPRGRRSRSGSCRVATTRTSAGRPTPTSRPPARRFARSSAALGTTLDGPPYNLVLHTAPLREQVDATYHWHWEIHPRLREIAGPRAGDRAAGQPGLPGGRRRGASRPARDRAGPRSRGPRADGGSAAGGRRHTGRIASVSGPTERTPNPMPPRSRHRDRRSLHGRRARQPDRRRAACSPG